jgi:hypothetical protein
MCDTESNFVGELVNDEIIIYRACSKSSFLSKSKDAVQDVAFYKQGMNHTDGLSLALSPADSIRELDSNHGVLRIRVGSIHGLGYGLEVRTYLTDATHVLIRNLPCMDREHEREAALKVASELAVLAEIESAQPVAKTVEL